MKEEDLKRLIDRYYKGESSEEEENILREFFNKNDIPEGYEAEKEIFSFYIGLENIPEPSIDFEARILAGIDASERVAGSKKTKRYIVSIMSAAAGLLLLAGSYFYFTNKAEPADTFKDPEIAYAETIKILRDVSFQLNRRSQILEPVGKMNEITNKSFKTINKSTRIVEKSLKNLNYLQKSDKIRQYPTGKNINN